MEIQNIKSSTVLIQNNDTKVLCDPWILDGAFMGSWAHYPPVEYEPADLENVDYLYISHIHPDHCHIDTLKRMDKDIPVYIHDFQWDFLKNNIERLGFTVHELPHNERVHLGDNLHINILAADNCDPEVCGSYFGCQWYAEAVEGEESTGSTQIDSLAVFDNGDEVIVNANDCRWPMTKHAGNQIKQSYGNIDILLVQYSPAGGYPQCRFDYTPEQMETAGEERRKAMYESALSFIDLFDPDYYMPFAGSYVLSGKYHNLNKYVANPTKNETKQYLERSPITSDSSCILLNSGETFDVNNGLQSASFEPIDPEARDKYIKTHLADRQYTYENDPKPTVEDFEPYVQPAYEHFEEKRQEIGYTSNTDLFVQLVNDQYLKIPIDDSSFHYSDGVPEQEDRKQIIINADPRLMLRIFKGPKYAHFNNAQIGSHLQWAIRPDVYERTIFYCLSFLHQ